MFHKKLRQAGGSWSIVIPKVILEAMNINPVLDELSITLDDDTIKLKKYKKQDK